jgi:predicted small lipoprotein YifL
MRRAIAMVLLVTALAACGQRTPLKPKAGSTPPPAPYGREEPHSSAVLLEPPVQAIPERSVELRKRSEEREDDPFDLPPE